MPGQLGQITDAVVAPCKPYKSTENTHQCLFLANPYQAAVKVFDITDNQFVLSPIGYFPLVIKAGTAPYLLVNSNENVLVFDQIEQKIYEIPEDFTKAQVTQNAWPQSTCTSTPKNLNGASVLQVTCDANGKTLWALNNKTLVLDTGNGIEITAPLDTNAAAIYLPTSLAGTPSTCCNGEANWVGVLLTNGILQYWPYSAGVFNANNTKQSIDLVLTTGVGSFTLTNPPKLLGAQVQNTSQDGLSCERRLFLVYSGTIFNTCEGSSNIKRVDQMEY